MHSSVSRLVSTSNELLQGIVGCVTSRSCSKRDTCGETAILQNLICSGVLVFTLFRLFPLLLSWGGSPLSGEGKLASLTEGGGFAGASPPSPDSVAGLVISSIRGLLFLGGRFVKKKESWPLTSYHILSEIPGLIFFNSAKDLVR